MSTIDRYKRVDISKNNALFSNFRTIIETAFYGNNLTEVQTVRQAYELAVKSSGTIKTDLPIYRPKEWDLPGDSKVLVENTGQVVGRTALARRVIGHPGINAGYYAGILREAIYQGSQTAFYHCSIVVGLDPSFMIKSHLMLPAGFENNLYSYLLNFQIINNFYEELYHSSAPFEEGDIYIYNDPRWSHPDFPDGLVLFDPDHNAAAVLGLRYFGELKKATLTLAWNIAHRQGFVACHGGMKQYHDPDKKTAYTMAAFGLSGSGKSTITLAEHPGFYPVTVLHDDAFVISKEIGSSVALEPAYFDKTQDYPLASKNSDYFLTVQNVGVTLDETGKKVLVTEDIRNGNGRTVKSRFSTPNRVDIIPQKIDAIYWIMKDDSLPPLVRIEDPILATVFGVTLATKRTTAENVQPDVDLEQIVIEPFANPFRIYPLGEDYTDFRDLFEQKKAECYILNTGFFNKKKITPKITLTSIEAVVAQKYSFKPMGPLTAVSYLPIEGYIPDFSDRQYLKKLRKSMETRSAFIQDVKEKNNGYDALPEETSLLLQRQILELESALKQEAVKNNEIKDGKEYNGICGNNNKARK